MEFVDTAFIEIMKILVDGYNNLNGWIRGLLMLVFLIDLLLLAVRFMSGTADANKDLIEKLLTYGFWSLMIFIFPDFMDFMQSVFTSIGLVAGGTDPSSVISETVKTPLPTTILAQGIMNGQPIIDAFNKVDFLDVGSKIFYFVCWGIMMFAYVNITITFVMSYVEFAVLAGIGGIFLPFGLLKQTRFLSEKFLGSVTGHAIKLLLLNFILAVASPVLGTINALLDNLTPNGILASITVTFIFMMLVQNIPSMATGLLSGSPTMSNNGFGAGAMMGVGAAVMAGRALKTAGQGLLQGGVKGAGGIAKAVGAAQSAMGSYAQNAHDSGMMAKPGKMVAAALMGGGQSLAGSLGASFKSGAGSLVNRAMYGKNAAPKPDSLKATRSAGEYIKNRFNQGNQSEYAAQTGNNLLNNQFSAAAKKEYKSSPKPEAQPNSGSIEMPQYTQPSFDFEVPPEPPKPDNYGYVQPQLFE